MREWLGHKDVESIKAYLVHLKNEEAIESGKVDAGYVDLRGMPKNPPKPREDTGMPVTIPDATTRELRWS